MKKVLGLFLLLLPVVGMMCTGCSAIFRTVESGPVIEKSYEFTDFTNVEISDAFNYHVSRSDSYNVAVTGRQNVLEHLDIYQSGNTLHIGMRFGIFDTANTKVNVTLPQLNKLVVSASSQGEANGFDSAEALEVRLSGASELNLNVNAGVTAFVISGSSEITGTLNSSALTANLSGASNMDMNLKTGKATIAASGSSEIDGELTSAGTGFTLSGASKCTLTGSCGDAVILASGASEMNSPGLLLQTADVTLTGASDAIIFINGALNIDVSGSSTLDYIGNPTIEKIDISGGSQVNHK